MENQVTKMYEKRQTIKIEDSQDNLIEGASAIQKQQRQKMQQTEKIIENNKIDKILPPNSYLSKSSLNIVVIIIHGRITFQYITYHPSHQIPINQNTDLKTFKDQHAICILLQKKLFQQKIEYFNNFHYKKKYLKNLLLDKVNLNLSSRRIDQLVKNIKNQQVQEKSVVVDPININMDKGIYFLINGQYEIHKITQNGIKICVGQTSQSYFGQQCLWENQYHYRLSVKSKTAQYMFINLEILITILNQQQWTELKQKLKQFYLIKNQSRLRQFNSVLKIKKRIQDQNNKIKKFRKVHTQRKDNEDRLKLLIERKPQWLIEKEQKQILTLNMRKNIFHQHKETQKQRKKKYFSVKLKPDSNDLKFQKQVMKKHLSEKQIKNDKYMHTTFLNLNNTIDFSKFAKTTFINSQRKTNPDGKSKIQKKQSENKFDMKIQISSKSQQKSQKWDSSYSKYYDRTLADSCRKQKHLSLILKLKSKLFPEKRGQMFTFQDAVQTNDLSFYALQKKRCQQSEQKNKRTFQKIFKTKLLTTNPATKYPTTFR